MMRHANRIMVGVVFVLAGLNHFRVPRMYQAIMPPYMPQHEALVALSGYAELSLGALALLPTTRRWAGYGLIALLIAVFPANVHMALHPEQYRAIPGWLLWARLPLQGVLIAWVHWATAEAEPNPVLRHE